VWLVSPKESCLLLCPALYPQYTSNLASDRLELYSYVSLNIETCRQIHYRQFLITSIDLYLVFITLFVLPLPLIEASVYTHLPNLNILPEVFCVFF